MAFQLEADLPPAFACLKNVDALLRCPICFDFLNISMMTKCSHNFCSLCIRKFLSYKLQCPVCNTQATEQDLRNNRLLDDLVVNFQAARQQLSKANFESPPISPKTPGSTAKCKTPREKDRKCNSVLSNFFQKRTKTSPAKETNQDGAVAHYIQRGKIQTTRIHNENSTDLPLATDQLPGAVKEEHMDVEVASMQDLMSGKQEDTVLHRINTGIEMAHSSSTSAVVKPVAKVECPVCSVSVSQQFINKHLDTCLTSGEKKESLRSSPGNLKRPMAKLVYNLLSMQELKRRLKECHLSMQGSRDQMIKRHKEFVQIYNAQCDSLNPKSAEDIAREVETNEKMRNQLQGKTKPVMFFTKNQSEKEIDEMHSQYRKQHSSDFSRLIAQVRGRLETTRQTRIKQESFVEGEGAQNTDTAGQVKESKSCLVIKVEDRDDGQEPSAIETEFSPSPTYSDVSISRDAERTSLQKRTSSSRGENIASSPVFGKRRRKS
ncbi:E3 ubiquitin-protein ligase RAD18 isoform X2 [Channa argus]|uniref:E3 ubiquitin-protein ligase RAD18 isoform X2 n=1 Tax=Channa argus TaxID=215402 RepID=UPI003522B9DB